MSIPPGKRQFDLIIAVAVTAVSSPLWIIIAVAVKISSCGPVFHRAQRCGFRGKLFTLYKFRTMRVSGSMGPRITAGHDDRVTAVGGFLRRWKLDELPQLINVVKGDMSLVGPRPEDPAYVLNYGEIEIRVLEFLPGITSPASIIFRNEQELLGQSSDPERTYREIVLPRKLAVDAEYFSSSTVLSDARVLLRTLATVLGATAPPID